MHVRTWPKTTLELVRDYKKQVLFDLLIYLFLVK